MYTRIETITPEVASRWLANDNNKNRTMREHHAHRIANAIANGEWHENGDSIKISRTGRVLDGQHRLQGVVLSGRSITVAVVYDLDDDAFAHMDTNRIMRLARDVLQVDGFKNAKTLASIIRAVSFYDAHRTLAPHGPGESLSNEDIRAIASGDPGYPDAATFGQSHCISGVFTPLLLGFAHYTTHRIDRECGDAFCAAIATPFGEQVGIQPASAFVRRMYSNSGKIVKMSRMQAFEALIRAWNSYRIGKTLTKIPLRSESRLPDMI